MRATNCFPMLVMAIALFGIPAHAGFGFKLDGTLDKEAISRSYFDGDFARVLPPLEMYRQSFPATATKEDSIFVFKYLSVIFAADSSTRTKAESYMVQLVKLMPTIELIDLYISDNIQAIFKNVKEDYLKQQKYIREHDVYGYPTDSVKIKKDTSALALQTRKSNKTVWWTLTGIGAAAAAIGIVYFVSAEPESKDNEYTFKP